MHLTMKQLLITLTILSLLLTLVPKSFADQQTLRVSPVINELDLSPGKPLTFDVTIENQSDVPVGIHADIFGLDETGQTEDYDQAISPLTNWTTVSPIDSIINPHSQNTLQVKITPPKDTKDGGYYETIFLTPIINKTLNQNAPEILNRIGVLVFGTVGKLNYDDLSNKVMIKEFKPTHFIFDKPPAELTFTVTNNYFTHSKFKPFLSIKPLFGKEQTKLLEEKYILPGRSKVWNYALPDSMNTIFYKSKLAVSVGAGHQIFAETWFVIFPYKILLESIIIIVLCLLILFRRKQFKKAVKILLMGK